MASLVDYSSSSEDEPATPPGKKRKLSHADKGKGLPPLPAAFLDQYSSTVRTSAQDDPSLHGGRKRVTPHVQGNWPTHVYLEWHPNAKEAKVLADVVSSAQASPRTKNDKAKRNTATHDAYDNDDDKVHSLLENDLGVSLPLHISLSRPLTLKTEQKDLFLSRLREAVSESNVKAFHVQPKNLAWHSNENCTRWFLVLRLLRFEEQETSRLLDICNNIASDFGQPLLYTTDDRKSKGLAEAEAEVGGKFHISVAWSLEAPIQAVQGERRRSMMDGEDVGVPYELLGRLTAFDVGFSEVKVRIGQDVHAVPLKAARRKT